MDAVSNGLRPFLTARVQDLGFRKITLWGGKYVNFSRTQKLRIRGYQELAEGSIGSLDRNDKQPGGTR